MSGRSFFQHPRRDGMTTRQRDNTGKKTIVLRAEMTLAELRQARKLSQDSDSSGA